jgi:ubiquinone/menaquinone biosynthesis C-methylase UbiE
MSIARNIFYMLPPRMRFLARRMWYAPTDLFEKLIGKRTVLVPPKGLIYTGSGDFLEEGQRVAARCVSAAGLQPHHKILDIGSGMGRLAVALTDILDKNGAYEGFDVVENGVRWCQRNISSRHPNFQFHYIPLANDLYRADGADAATFKFPWNAGSFNVICANSLFTHLQPAETLQYLREIKRVMHPEGHCLSTFFLINQDSRVRLAKNTTFNFPHDFGHYHLMDEQVKAANVAYLENWLLQEAKLIGLEPLSIHYGRWCGRQDSTDFQDVIVWKLV